MLMAVRGFKALGKLAKERIPGAELVKFPGVGLVP